MAKKQKYYVVWVGAKPGIYNSWPDCQKQVAGFPKARYKSFESKLEAELALKKGYSISSKSSKQKSSTSNPRSNINYITISVDAACSGNPGKMEYQGVDTKSGKQYFHFASKLGTNNIGEFLAIVHGLSFLKKQNSKRAIYTDSKSAMSWVRNKKCKTTLERNTQTEELYKVIERAENWLKQNTYNTEILKWDTKSWGEIPADFGRK
jgi:ribonuclease HI